MRNVIKFFINIIMLVSIGLFGVLQYSNYINEQALEAARITTIRSNIGKYVVAPHVVKISVKDNGIDIGSGTGFHLEYLDKVRLVTNKHICDQSEGPRQMFVGNKQYRILAISTNQDICILESNRIEGLKLATTDVHPTDKVILVGHPRGLALTIREGYVMEENKDSFPWLGDDAVDYKMISAISYPGNSGSPVTNENGEVVGILFAGSSQYITEGLIVPYKTLIKFLAKTYKL